MEEYQKPYEDRDYERIAALGMGKGENLYGNFGRGVTNQSRRTSKWYPFLLFVRPDENN